MAGTIAAVTEKGSTDAVTEKDSEYENCPLINKSSSPTPANLANLFQLFTKSTRSTKMCQIVSIHSFRGGTGKSNLVANVAANIAKQGKKCGCG